MTRLSIRLLGPLEILRDGEPASLESNKVRALLAYLAAQPRRPHPRASLAGLLWPELPDDAARHNLRQALANLRLALGDRDASVPLLLIDREAVRLNPNDDLQLDIATFTGLLADCHTHLHRRLETCVACVRRMGQAVEQYRGGFLDGFFLDDSVAFEEWALLMRERLHHQALDALGRLAAYHERRGVYAAAHRYAVRQVELEPWREEAHRQALRALALDGRRGAALAQYERCRAILQAELGVDPEPETTALKASIERGALQSAAVEPASAQLPMQPTPFVGREAELAGLAELLANPACRLLTIVGPGGMGKTRLALEAAAEQAGAFVDGVYFVALAALESADLLPTTIGDALGLTFQGAQLPKQQLLAYLHQREMLLVLDNFEQLLDGAGLLTEIAERARNVALLVTSRVRLALRAEWLFDLSGLPYPPPASSEPLETFEAARLFLQSARQSRRQFVVAEPEAQAIARICRLVEGLPLALELTAAAVRERSCTEIAGAIEAAMRVPEAPWRDTPERHRSMRAVFEHSWRLLSEPQRAVLRKLSVFRGGFEASAAAQIAEATEALLVALVDASLLRRSANERYDMHELVRQYAHEQLQAAHELPHVCDLHLSYFLTLAEEAEPQVRRAEGFAWLDRLDTEHDNIRAALAWSLEHDAELSLRLAGAQAQFWSARGYLSEGRRWLTDALRQGEHLSAQIRAKAIQATSWLVWAQGDYTLAGDLGEQCLSLCRMLGDQRGVAAACEVIGISARAMRNYNRAMSFFEQGLAIYRDLNDKQGIADTLISLSGVVYRRSEYAHLETIVDEAINLYEQLGDQSGVDNALGMLMLLLERRGDYARSAALAEQSLAFCRRRHDKIGIAAAMGILGFIAMAHGDYLRAAQLYEDSLVIFQETGSKRGIALRMCDQAAIDWARGNYAVARDRCEQADAMLVEIGDTLNIGWSRYYLGRLALSTGEISTAIEHCTESVTLFRNPEFKPGLASALCTLGKARCQNKQYGEARAQLIESLSIRGLLGHPQEIADSLEGLVQLVIAMDAPDRAARLLGAASAIRASSGFPLHPSEHVDCERVAAVARAQLGEAAFAAAWTAGRALTPDEAIALALAAG